MMISGFPRRWGYAFWKKPRCWASARCCNNGVTKWCESWEMAMHNGVTPTWKIGVRYGETWGKGWGDVGSLSCTVVPGFYPFNHGASFGGFDIHMTYGLMFHQLKGKYSYNQKESGKLPCPKRKILWKNRHFSGAMFHFRGVYVFLLIFVKFSILVNCSILFTARNKHVTCVLPNNKCI